MNKIALVTGGARGLGEQIVRSFLDTRFKVVINFYKSEIKAIEMIFGNHAERINICSTKSMTGHLLGAAGAIESIAALISINDSFIPPTINHFNYDEEINPKLNLYKISDTQIPYIRNLIEKGRSKYRLSAKPKSKVQINDFFISVDENKKILLREYVPKNVSTNKVILYFHGGGYVLNSVDIYDCLLYTSPSPRDLSTSRMPSSA